MHGGDDHIYLGVWFYLHRGRKHGSNRIGNLPGHLHLFDHIYRRMVQGITIMKRKLTLRNRVEPATPELKTIGYLEEQIEQYKKELEKKDKEIELLRRHSFALVHHQTEEKILGLELIPASGQAQYAVRFDPTPVGLNELGFSIAIDVIDPNTGKPILKNLETTGTNTIKMGEVLTLVLPPIQWV